LRIDLDLATHVPVIAIVRRASAIKDIFSEVTISAKMLIQQLVKLFPDLARLDFPQDVQTTSRLMDLQALLSQSRQFSSIEDLRASLRLSADTPETDRIHEAGMAALDRLNIAPSCDSARGQR
jgi:hypothetical protein